MFQMLMEWGAADNIADLGRCFSACIQAAETPIHIWGYTINVLQVVYGCTATYMIAEFMHEIANIIDSSRGA